MISKAPTSIDEYIADFPEDIQALLNQVRFTIKQAAPDAEESLGYGMPAYKLHGRPLVYFATPTGHAEFAKELSTYKQGKGSVQFPIDQPMPLKLIAQIVEFRVIENLEKAKAKKK